MKALQDARISLGLTQKALAQRIGCARTAISRIENGVPGDSRRLHTLVAQALGVAYDPPPKKPVRRGRPPGVSRVEAKLDHVVELLECLLARLPKRD